MNKNLCEKCNTPKISYYGSKCPICDKPELENYPTLNLIQVLHYIEHKYNKNYKELWSVLYDVLIFRNNSYEIIWLDEVLKNPDDYDETYAEVLEIVKEDFNTPNKFLFHISW